ncbi:hypothetical protein A8926_3030 [Saccharopolyspora spinosa]|uniref:Uncharacterized protein n=1 Tax=Saccharopolyspora spinosa TaxID=60894 RepID=A0A2N3XXE2_SACSN|nr:hypothetical protein A8926_3030 [Saccharopolyspora spinosa]
MARRVRDILRNVVNEPARGLLRDPPPSAHEFPVDAAMPVTPLVLLEDRLDRGLELLLRIGAGLAGLVVEKRRPGQPGNVEQHLETMLSPDSDHGGYFRRCSCALKARNFPR